MALVDINSLGATRLDVVTRTLLSYESGIIRQKERVDEAKELYEELKNEVKSICTSQFFKPIGILLGQGKIEVKLTRAAVGEDPELRVILVVARSFELQLIDRLRKLKMDFKVTAASEKNWGGYTRIVLVLHEYLNRSEARVGGSIRPT